MNEQMYSLHQKITNIPPRRTNFARYVAPDLAREHYMDGHRDARHAAAELVAACASEKSQALALAQSRIRELEAALRRIAGLSMSQFLQPYNMAEECVNLARAALGDKA